MDFDFRKDPVLSRAFDYWRSKRGSRAMPARRDIDPIEMPKEILPHLQIIEVIENGARFRYRLIGTALVEAFGRDYSGKFPEEVLSPERVVYIQDIYRQVCAARRPVFSRNRYSIPNQLNTLLSNRVYLPLSNDDTAVDSILGAMRFDYRHFQRVHGAWGNAVLDSSLQYTAEIAISDE